MNDHCVKSVQIQSFFWSVLPVFSPNARKYGPEKTQHLDAFQAVDVFQKISYILLHSLQVTKFVNLKNIKKSDKPHSNYMMRTAKNRLTLKTVQKTLNFPSIHGNLRANKKSLSMIWNIYAITIHIA